jgi:hypothetical protein
MTTQESKPNVQVNMEPSKLEGEMRRGINWFFWIAALSLVNFVILRFGSDRSFVIGLGITQLIDVHVPVKILRTPIIGDIARLIMTVYRPAQILLHRAGFSPPMAEFTFELILAILIASVFLLFGVLGRRGSVLAVALGIILYALDSGIFFYYGDYLSLAFHIFALVALAGGLRALYSLKKLQPGQQSA